VAAKAGWPDQTYLAMMSPDGRPYVRGTFAVRSRFDATKQEDNIPSDQIR
jgi:hypothetical protein